MRWWVCEGNGRGEVDCLVALCLEGFAAVNEGLRE